MESVAAKMIIDVPRIKLLVDRSFLGPKLKGYENAYLYSVTGIINRPLLFNVHLESGALFSRLPIHALFTKPAPKPPPLNILMPWGVIGNKIQCIEHEYLKNYEVLTSLGTGRYLFTIDQFDGGFSEDPEQHKTMNIIAIDDGWLAALPNNMCRFLDRHFTNHELPTAYERQSAYWTTD
ncbi:hypothetical protein [Microcystis sp. M061S2]|uniref:hypothetical protein n=1 Tax=Microcystis sp. M061S2 TaxID=2771171 RepID=UPI002583E483|nr:hypothetical protein [Microcystis sp. M061S2]MCA2654529.1 hypothetical protein [Microcystis sp. M061S2]